MNSAKGPAEDKIYGRNAARATFTHRPHAIVRVYIETEVVKEFGDLLQWCAKQKRAYHVVAKADMEKIAKSVHHEGIMLVAKAKPAVSEAEMLKTLQAKPAPVLFLDRIGNPHNLGAFARTAAHFGVPYLIVGAKDAASMSPSLARVAQGGLEHVDFVSAVNPESTLQKLKQAGYKIFGTSSHAKMSIFATKFSAKSAFVFGNEVFGVSRKIESLCDETLIIPGTGKVESLNVSVACGLVLGVACQ